MISFVIPAAEYYPALRRTVERLRGRRDVEVIIVTDGDHPSIPKVLELAGENIRVLDLGRKKQGKVKAVNEGAKLARGDLVFMDADTEFAYPNFLDLIREGFQKYDVFTGKIICRAENWIQKMAYMDLLAIGAVIKRSMELGIVPGLHGAFICVRKEVYEELGGFRPVITEDIDFGIRAWEKKFRLGYIEDLVLYTRAPQSFGEWWKQRRRWASGGAQMVKRNWRLVLKNLKLVVPSLIKIYPSIVTVFSLWLLPLAPLTALTGIFGSLALAWNNGKILEEYVRIRDLVVYSLVYNPLWFATAVISVIRPRAPFWVVPEAPQ